jgi:hypothetical protein
MDRLELPTPRRLAEDQFASLERKLLDQIASTAPKRRRLPRRRILMAAAALCAAGGSAAALAVAFRGQPGTDIACLSDPTLAARVYDMVPNQQDPIAACQREWLKGRSASPCCQARSRARPRT